MVNLAWRWGAGEVVMGRNVWGVPGDVSVVLCGVLRARELRDLLLQMIGLPWLLLGSLFEMDSLSVTM